MMPFPHHMDKALSLSVPQCLSGDRDESMAEEREVYLSSSLSQDAAEEQPRKRRILMIQGELVDLTGDLLTASILGQMVYWCQYVKDFDLYIAEERANPPKCFSALRHGWFYKSSRELIVETMLGVNISTLHRYMSFLKVRGWIQTRRNPENKLDPKIQYRVSLRKLCNNLQRKGHTLSSLEAYGIFPHVPKGISLKSSQNSNLNKTNSAAQGNINSKERSL